MNKRIYSIILLLVLTSCSASYPVAGKTEKNHLQFVGIATTWMGGNGKMSATMDDGTSCEGKYSVPAMAAIASGSGTLQCSNGKTATYNFSGDASGGKGFGKFNDGEKFQFIFGDIKPITTHQE